MNESETIEFKKPILIGKRGKFPRKISVPATKDVVKENQNVEIVDDITESEETDKSDVQQLAELRLPYTEPEWSGIPGYDTKYSFEVLKAGRIIESIDLLKKSYWVFGRLSNCDMLMAHPTISRYHAVLQYRSKSTDKHSTGFYLYDLDSTHGTFLNKNRLKSRVYVKVQVGHMIRLGCSSRMYILVGPDDDKEEESELTLTELKQKRQDELEKRNQEKQKLEANRLMEVEESKRLDEERGINWGMGEDADEATDLSENPYAQTNNEELYIDDPKKALRGFMEREDFDLEYNCEEQGIGQFLCKVELPIEDEHGRPVFAEVIHKGKKKEAVVQCALEACRILDRHGLLRQAVHASRKRKAKNWEENDYYDSDEDPFLDRTGSIERKRENRMKGKTSETVETYDSLLVKEKALSNQIKGIKKQLKETEEVKQKQTGEEEDPLDSFMKELSNSKLDKQKVVKLKTELVQLKKEHAKIIKLLNIAKPADLPPLKPSYDNTQLKEETTKEKQKGLPIFGKRMKVKVQVPESSNICPEIESEEEEEQVSIKSKNSCLCSVSLTSNIPETMKEILEMEQRSLNASKTFYETMLSRLTAINVNQEEHLNYEEILKNYITALNNFSNVQQQILSDVKEIDETLINKPNKEKVEESKLEENRISDKAVDDVKQKEKKQNQRRIQQRQEKYEKAKQKGYKEDSLREDYNMWIPPENQTGDGRTSLNEKLGY